jgi:hypothetical protein
MTQAFPPSPSSGRRVTHPALPLRHCHGYAVVVHRDIIGRACGAIPRVPDSSITDTPGYAPLTRPYHRVRAGQLIKKPQHRFLAHAFPSRSPSPTRPVVPGRPDFVAAAPRCPLSAGQAAVSSTRPLRRPSDEGLSPPSRPTVPRGSPPFVGHAHWRLASSVGSRRWVGFVEDFVLRVEVQAVVVGVVVTGVRWWDGRRS